MTGIALGGWGRREVAPGVAQVAIRNGMAFLQRKKRMINGGCIPCKAVQGMALGAIGGKTGL